MRPGRAVAILVAVHLSRRLLTVILALFALALAVPAATLAAGGGSAGDQQYTDPFAGTSTPTATSHPTTPTSTTPAPATTTAPPPVDSTPAQTAPAPTAATATTPSASASADGSATTTDSTARPTTLAFTGYDSWLAGGLGFAMVAGGITLRRRARRA